MVRNETIRMRKLWQTCMNYLAYEWAFFFFVSRAHD